MKILRLSLFAHRYSQERASLVGLSKGGRAQLAAICSDFHHEFLCLLGILALAVVETGFTACFASTVQCEATGNQHNGLHGGSYIKQLECINNCWSRVLSIFHTKQMFAFIVVVLC